MAKFVDVIKKGDIYICDSCKKDIPAKEMKLTEAVDNIEILTPMSPFIYIDKDGVVTGGNKQPSKELGDQILCCPHCNAAHIFGFNLKT